MHKRVGDKGGDGTAEGYYGKVSEGLFTDHGLSEPWDLGRFTYFEVFTFEHILPGWCYILARGYTGGTNYKNDEEHTYKNIQTVTIANSVSDLVDKYINAPTFGHGIKIGDKRIVPVRNMRPDDKERERLKLGHSCGEPLNEKEIAEFKHLLQLRDPERYKLSFP